MLRNFGSHLRDQWMGALALFLVLTGGTAYAIDGPLAGQNTVGSEDIITGEVKSTDIADGRVFNVDLADNLITGQKMKDGSVTGADIEDESLEGLDVEDESLEGLDIEDASVWGHDIRDESITEFDIQDAVYSDFYGEWRGGIGSAEIRPNSVNGDHLEGDSVTSSEVEDNSLIGDDINELTLSGVRVGGREVITSAGVSAPQHAFTSANANCPGLKKVIGGGFYSNSPVRVHESIPIDADTWHVSVYNDLTPTGAYVEAWAVCANSQ